MDSSVNILLVVLPCTSQVIPCCIRLAKSCTIWLIKNISRLFSNQFSNVKTHCFPSSFIPYKSFPILQSVPFLTTTLIAEQIYCFYTIDPLYKHILLISASPVHSSSKIAIIDRRCRLWNGTSAQSSGFESLYVLQFSCGQIRDLDVSHLFRFLWVWKRYLKSQCTR